MPLSGYSVIYGGSFNPPHFGHAIAASWMVETLNAAEVIMVPTYKHAFGKDLLDFEHRVAMCKLMCAQWEHGNPMAQYLASEGEISPGKVWTSEIERDLPHPNITLNTVQRFGEVRKKLAVAVGSDLLHDLDEWTGWNEVMNLAKIVVIGRMGSGHADHDYELYQYPVELSAISSSQIRGQIRRGKDITGLVPASIKEYIRDNGLYK